jgi:hypothetical protein
MYLVAGLSVFGGKGAEGLNAEVRGAVVFQHGLLAKLCNLYRQRL